MGNCCRWDSRYESLDSRAAREPLIGTREQKATVRPDDNIIFGQDKLGNSFLSIFDPVTKTLKSANLPKTANFFNYSAITWKSNTVMIVCGGIKHNLTGITASCFEFDLENLTCTPLPDMINYRYTYPAIYFEGKIYCVGGRVYGGDDTSILKSCEVYDYSLKKWASIADLNVPRCTSTLITYKSAIWVIGGYTGQYQRSRKIERYNPVDNVWEVTAIKLLCGFENGNILETSRPNEFIVFGGKLNYGNSRNVWLYDLENQTVMNKKPLYHDNILSKHFRGDDGKVFLLGENPLNNFFYETYDIDTTDVSNGQLILPAVHTYEKFKQYNFNSRNLAIAHEPASDLILKDYADTNVIFGTDSEPFQLEINSQTLEVSKHPIKLNIKLRNFQGCCRIDDNRVFFTGGINISFQKISARTFIYDMRTKTITKLPDMHRIRYTFPVIYMGNCVYVIGGREYGDDKAAIFCDCERFNFSKMAWERVPSLNVKRCTANVFKYKERLFVAGGFLPTSKRSDIIEVLNEKKKRWETLGVLLPIGIEASCFVSSRTDVFFLTGRSDKGDCNNKFVFNLKSGDIDEIETLTEKVDKESCLNKLIVAKEKFVVFGGSEFSNIMIVNSHDYMNTVTESKSYRGDNSTTMDDEISVSELESLKKEIKNQVSNVCFSSHYLKRNSYVSISKYSL
jgi:hypothetical protein